MTFEVEPNLFDGRSILKSSRAINLLNMATTTKSTTRENSENGSMKKQSTGDTSDGTSLAENHLNAKAY